MKIVFPLIPPDIEGTETTIKWSQANTRYEIVVKILDDIDIAILLPHCLDVRQKVLQTVTTQANKGPSLFKVFPRTLSHILSSVWDNILVDNPPAVQNEASFDECIRAFIAVHSSEEEQYELLQQLTTPPQKKPREFPVQAMFYRLRQLNSYIEWLPGAEVQLNNDHLKQCFFDHTPQAWAE